MVKPSGLSLALAPIVSPVPFAYCNSGHSPATLLAVLVKKKVQNGVIRSLEKTIFSWKAKGIQGQQWKDGPASVVQSAKRLDEVALVEYSVESPPEPALLLRKSAYI